MNKSEQISATLKATREKRKAQICKVFEVKVDKSHLSKTTKDSLNRIFLEAKWLYNFALSQSDIFSMSGKLNTVDVKVGQLRIGNEESEDTFVGIFEKRELNVLGSQIKQGILSQLCDNIKALSAKKKKGIRVGRLKFRSYIASVNLKQFGNTYRIKGQRIKIQGITQWLRVRGIEQFKDFEIANAKFIKKAGDFYFKITCYGNIPEPIINRKQIGIDMGILSQITLSNGIDIKYQVYVDMDSMKRACRTASIRKQSRGSNYFKAQEKVNKLYEKSNNQKNDIKNKIVSILKTEFGLIAYQNDCMQGWQRLWGRRMLNTAIGGIMKSLKETPTAIEVDRFFASTKECPICKHKQNIGLSERIFKCDHCGYEKPRDWKSAECILDEALRKIGAERTKSTLVETESSTLHILERLNAIPHVNACSIVDARSPSPLGVG